MTSNAVEDYPTLPGIRQRTIINVNGLSVRILAVGKDALEAGLASNDAAKTARTSAKATRTTDRAVTFAHPRSG